MPFFHIRPNNICNTLYLRPKQFLQDDQQKKYQGEGDADTLYGRN